MLTAAIMLLFSLNVEAAIATPSSNAEKSSAKSAVETKADAKVDMAAEAEESKLKISINLAARSLAVFDGAEKIRLYPIGPGKTSTPTPTGYYKVQYMEKNPDWISPHDKTVIKSGPACPLGYRWIGFRGSYGIHGTNKPESIGGYVSDGCVRMRETDVEALYELTKVGTPVEITYNRVVVEKLADATVVYYIYPDGYGWQPLKVADVAKWLGGFGVSSFESDAAIAEKIADSDGNPTYIAQAFPLYVNGKKLASPAVRQDGETYIPVIDVAQATGIDIGYTAATQTLTTRHASALGYDKKDVLYCTARDAKKLFALTGSQDKANNYILKSAIKEPKATMSTDNVRIAIGAKAETSSTASTAKKTEQSAGANRNTTKSSSTKTIKTKDSWVTKKVG